LPPTWTGHYKLVHEHKSHILVYVRMSCIHVRACSIQRIISTYQRFHFRSGLHPSSVKNIKLCYKIYSSSIPLNGCSTFGRVRIKTLYVRIVFNFQKCGFEIYKTIKIRKFITCVCYYYCYYYIEVCGLIVLHPIFVDSTTHEITVIRV